ncbi:hypothetical protein ACGGAQ_11850 [Micromonospora sp. NPDC047557]|uniref:hypothetical protein n=1 Tax=Micromonospora sp. NPDC047557 TaxID=3364250 RepID=UPI00371BC087
MIQWHRLDPRKFERAVQALLRSTYPGAEAMDGSGGDGGRDSTLRTQDGLVIFEIKSYSERLTKGQQRKIEASLRAAAAHEPNRWVLILPLNHSPKEEKWFEELKRKFPAIQLEWWGVDWLDGHFASREDLRRMVEGGEYRLLELAREFDKEKAVLASGLPDLAGRFGILTQRSRDLSPYWIADFASGPDGMTFIFRERYPGAAQDDPISLKPVFAFSPDDPEAAEVERDLRHVMDFGGDVTVPGKFVQEFNVDASEETRLAFGWDRAPETKEIQIKSVEDNSGLPIPCTLDVLTPGGKIAASITVQLSQRVGGARGYTITGADPSGLLTARFLLEHPDVRASGPSLNFQVSSPIGLFPWATRPVADFIAAVQPGNRMVLRMGIPFGECEVMEPIFRDEDLLVRLITALDELQKHFGQLFPIPEGLTRKDLKELETLVEFVRHGRAQWPYHTVKMQFHHDKLEELVADESFTPEGGALLARFDSFGMKFGDNRFDVGRVQFYAPRIRLANFEQVRAAIGTGVDPDGRWECIDGEHIYMRSMSNTIEGEVSG